MTPDNKPGKDIEKGASVYRMALRFLLAAAALFLIVIIVTVVTVDPFFQYHEPLEKFPYIVDNQLSQNPGMARNMEYDSCVIGSSMTVNFNTDDFETLMGLDTIKLSYSGALPHDDYNILEEVFDKSSKAGNDRDVRAVFCGVDVMTYTAGTEETKYPLPEYLYDNNPFNDIPYLLNKDVLFEYILRPIVNRSATDLSTVYASWWTPDYYNRELVLRDYEPAAESDTEMPENELIQGTKANLEENILPFIREHPETTFYMFFPPYSILYWNDVLRENHLDATMKQYEYIADRLLEYDNVRVFYFQNMGGTITNLNNYADYTHYKPEINKYMVTCFSNGLHEVYKGQMGKELDSMCEIIDKYDFDELSTIAYN